MHAVLSKNQWRDEIRAVRLRALRVDHKVWKIAKLCLPMLAHRVGLTLQRIATAYPEGVKKAQDDPRLGIEGG